MKIILKILATIMILGSFSLTVFAEDIISVPTSSQIVVDGEEVGFESYNIGGNNYFKLRDLAMAITGSQKQFEVSYNSEENAINLIGGSEYTVAGGELEAGGGTEKTAVLSSATLIIDDEKKDFEAYLINDNNYFKLRDIMMEFDVYVGWEEDLNLITLDTTMSYGEEEIVEEEVVTKEVVVKEVVAEEVADEEVSESQEEALALAIRYLSAFSFSKEGIIKQLVSAGFSEEEGIYAGENCGADWFEKAVKKAEAYVDLKPFTQESLVAQLIFEGFSEEEAVYGAEAVL